MYWSARLGFRVSKKHIELAVAIQTQQVRVVRQTEDKRVQEEGQDVGS